MKKTFALLAGILFAHFSFTQITNDTNTVGLLYTKPGKVSEGLILFAPNESKFTYLIDNCGSVAHQWVFETRSAYSNAYLLPDGSVVRIVVRDYPQNGNGCIERRSWENELIWRFCSNEENGFNFHSDLEYLPNGNFLVLSYQTSSAQDAIKAGVKPDLILGLYYTERLIELSPIGKDDATVVWEWNMLDHLVQNFDSTKLNYGNLKDNFRKIDANLTGFYHFNSVDYNAVLNQVMLSNYSSNEIYIIDHSTNIEEVKGSTGGKYGFGGDLLFRWGNPANYGATGKQYFLNQHDPQWIPDSTARFGGNISLFNNKYGELVDELDRSVSSIFILDIDPDKDGIYPINESSAFLPNEADYIWTGQYKGLNINSEIMSGIEVLPNGNLLICEALGDRFTEVDADEEIVWRYVSPEGRYGLIAQGEPAIADVYKIKKYGYDYIPQLNKQLCGTSIIENYNELTELCRSSLKPKIDITIATIELFTEDTLHYLFNLSEYTDSVMWDFGDGYTSNETKPVYTYTNPGAYIISLFAYNCYGTDSVYREVIINATTSIDEAGANSFVQTYPIPAHNELHIKIKSSHAYNQYSIYNIAGNFIKDGLYADHKIDISFLKEGVYFLQLNSKTDDKTFVKKFIKSK